MQNFNFYKARRLDPSKMVMVAKKRGIDKDRLFRAMIMYADHVESGGEPVKDVQIVSRVLEIARTLDIGTELKRARVVIALMYALFGLAALYSTYSYFWG